MKELREGTESILDYSTDREKNCEDTSIGILGFGNSGLSERLWHESNCLLVKQWEGVEKGDANCPGYLLLHKE